MAKVPFSQLIAQQVIAPSASSNLTKVQLDETFSNMRCTVTKPRTECECGAHAIGSKLHSDWCKLYDKKQLYKG